MFPAVSNLKAPESDSLILKVQVLRKGPRRSHNSLKITQHEWVNSDPENLSPEPSPQPQHCVTSHLLGHAEKFASRPEMLWSTQEGLQNPHWLSSGPAGAGGALKGSCPGPPSGGSYLIVMVITAEHQCVWLKWHWQRMRLPSLLHPSQHLVQSSPGWTTGTQSWFCSQTQGSRCRGELAQQQLIGERPNLTLPQRHIYGTIH